MDNWLTVLLWRCEGALLSTGGRLSRVSRCLAGDGAGMEGDEVVVVVVVVAVVVVEISCTSDFASLFTSSVCRRLK